MELFASIFNQSIYFLSDDWKEKYADLLSQENWTLIGERIYFFVFKNKIYHNPLPIFEEEIIEDYYIHYQYFEKIKLVDIGTINLGEKLAEMISELTNKKLSRK